MWEFTVEEAGVVGGERLRNRGQAGYVSRMRPWLVLLLAACGAASKPAPANDDNVLRGNYGGAAVVPHAEALAHVDATAEIPAGFETRIASPDNILVVGDGLMIGVSRLPAQDLPTVAAFIKKGFMEVDASHVESSEEWDGGWVAVFKQPTDPMRFVQGVVRAGKDDLFCAANEDDEVRKDTVEIAAKFCKSLRPT